MTAIHTIRDAARLRVVNHRNTVIARVEEDVAQKQQEFVLKGLLNWGGCVGEFNKIEVQGAKEIGAGLIRTYKKLFSEAGEPLDQAAVKVILDDLRELLDELHEETILHVRRWCAQLGFDHTIEHWVSKVTEEYSKTNEYLRRELEADAKVDQLRRQKSSVSEKTNGSHSTVGTGWYDELVKWRYGVPGWKLRYKLLGLFILVILVGGYFYWIGLNFEKGTLSPNVSMRLENSPVAGDVVQGDKVVVGSGSLKDVGFMRRKAKLSIRRSVENGFMEFGKLVESTNDSEKDISRRHSVKGTLGSGMELKDQENRVEAFHKKCDDIVNSVDRAIEDALIEQDNTAFNTAEWLQDERELYSQFSSAVAEKKEQAAELQKKRNESIL